jgi:nicotinate-nucleotide pyrophosphorylase (carboxylating)
MIPLPAVVLEDVVRRTLLEDLGPGGDPSGALVAGGAAAHAVIVAREAGVIAGLDAVALAFRMVDASVLVQPRVAEGTTVAAGAMLVSLHGPAAGILAAERTALNLLARMSGVASATARLVERLEGLKTKVLCTRKTMPGLRALDKYAVRLGGGVNHRLGLGDGVLIKDNHIALAGSVTEAIRRVKGHVGPMCPIEVEVEDLAGLEEALSEGAAMVLLDNMTPQQCGEAVSLVAARVPLEASGGIVLDNARAYGEAGVDYLSAGWLTHSARALDCSLDISNP